VRLAFDIEANGLLQEATEIHSLVIKDLDTGEVWSCAEQSTLNDVAWGLRHLEKADELWAHNGISYDYPLIRKLFPEWKPKGTLYDTLRITRLIWADLKERDIPTVAKNALPSRLAGSHSLEAWGYRLGKLKGTFGKTNDFSKWTPEMQTYCEQDVEVLHALVQLIDKRRAEWNWEEAIRLEHDFAWIIEEMCQNGVAFDEQAAGMLAAELIQKRADLTKRLQEVFPPKAVKLKTKVKHVPFNPGSRQQVVERFREKYQWCPVVFTDPSKSHPMGQPKIDEKVLKGLPYPEAKILAEYFTVYKLLGYLTEGDKAWLKLSKDGRIYPYINSNGAVTGRCTHSDPNTGNVPSKKTDPVYGPMCRALFVPSRDMVMVGADAAGLELRCFSHFLAPLDGGEYGKIVCEGDIHTKNQAAFGLPPGPQYRDPAKGGGYANIYGAQDYRLGITLFPDLGSPDRKAEAEAAGAKAREEFRKNVPAYATLVDNVQEIAFGPITGHRVSKKTGKKYPIRDSSKARGFLKGMDGRKLYVRSEHSALNTLLQSCGALLVKKATVLAYPTWKALGARLVLHVHDEVQLECPPENAKAAGQAFIESLQEAGKQWNFRIPLSGEYKIGASWKETH
jgi:DNA polymerase I-like protein with 3'-5' exonuclease and polymerase domains